MAFGSLNNQRDNTVSEINMVPLIDVMLVLLVIFIITAPLMTQPIKLQLPQTVAIEQDLAPEKTPILIAIDPQKNIFIDGNPSSQNALTDTLIQMKTKNQNIAQPIHLHIDASVPYENIAQLLALLSKSGFSQIGFISKPED